MRDGLKNDPPYAPAPALTQGLAAAVEAILTSPRTADKDYVISVLRALYGDHIQLYAFSVTQESELDRERDLKREGVAIALACGEAGRALQ